MSKETLEFHHDLHHKAYVDNGNKLIAGTEWENQSLEDIIRGTYHAGAVAQNGIFNNAYIGAGSDSAANRAAIGKFNESFSAYYKGCAPAGRTAQFVGGIQREGAASGISNRSIFAE